MIPCARFAFFTLTRDASFVTLAAALMMVGFSFEPPLAFKIGASVALLFAILLLVRSYFMSEERFLRSEAWRALRPEERPAGEHGKQLAQAAFQELMLRFAKTASGVAMVLYVSALVLSAATDNTVSDTFVTAAVAEHALK
jgi:hypothetical protein